MNIVIKQEQVKDYKITEEVVKNALLLSMAINRWMGLHEHLKTGVVSYPPRFQGEGNIKCFPNLIS